MQAWQGSARRGLAGLGMARQAWPGAAGRGKAGIGKAGLAGLGRESRGTARQGEARQCRHGTARPGEDRPGAAMQATGHGRPSTLDYEAAMKVEDSILSGVKTVVQDIIEREGKVAPTELVEAARPKNSPAHPAFEWDNRKAGEQWRVHQARNLIRVVRVTVEDREERLVHVPRVIVQGDETKEGYYRPISVVVEKPDEYQRALDAAVAKLNGAQSALDELHAVATQGGKTDAAAAIAQMSKATQLFKESLASLH